MCSPRCNRVSCWHWDFFKCPHPLPWGLPCVLVKHVHVVPFACLSSSGRCGRLVDIMVAAAELRPPGLTVNDCWLAVWVCWCWPPTTVLGDPLTPTGWQSGPLRRALPTALSSWVLWCVTLFVEDMRFEYYLQFPREVALCPEAVSCLGQQHLLSRPCGQESCGSSLSVTALSYLALRHGMWLVAQC